MTLQKPKPIPCKSYHRDGSLRASGQTIDGVPVGYWEWYWKDGTLRRSGHYNEAGEQTGEWNTCDKQGRIIVHKLISL